jgi:hypothetical protein
VKSRLMRPTCLVWCRLDVPYCQGKSSWAVGAQRRGRRHIVRTLRLSGSGLSRAGLSEFGYSEGQPAATVRHLGRFAGSGGLAHCTPDAVELRRAAEPGRCTTTDSRGGTVHDAVALLVDQPIIFCFGCGGLPYAGALRILVG